MDYTSSDSDIIDDIAKQEQGFQPEMDDFVITEICKGIPMGSYAMYVSGNI